MFNFAAEIRETMATTLKKNDGMTPMQLHLVSMLNFNSTEAAEQRLKAALEQFYLSEFEKIVQFSEQGRRNRECQGREVVIALRDRGSRHRAPADSMASSADARSGPAERITVAPRAEQGEIRLEKHWEQCFCISIQGFV